MKPAKESAAFKQMVTQEPAWKAFADIFASCLLRPSVPSYDDMLKIRDEMMIKVYKQQDSIKNVLAETERLTQAMLDKDLARAAGK